MVPYQVLLIYVRLSMPYISPVCIAAVVPHLDLVIYVYALYIPSLYSGCGALRIGSHGRHLGDGKLHQDTRLWCPISTCLFISMPYISQVCIAAVVPHLDLVIYVYALYIPSLYSGCGASSRPSYLCLCPIYPKSV